MNFARDRSSGSSPPRDNSRSSRGRPGRLRLGGIACFACVILNACSPFYAALNAGSTPDSEGLNQDLIVNALLLAASVRPVRYIFITNGVYNGEHDGDFGALNGNGIDDADARCNTDSARPRSDLSYAALLSDGLFRVATTSPNCRNGCTGQQDWPLLKYTDYIHADGRRIFTTDAAPIFVFGRLSDVLSTQTGATHWTGLNDDWTTATTCQRWTNSGATSGQVGMVNTLDGLWLEAVTFSCSSTAKLLCVQL